jgi:hypothetical protein
MSKHLKPIAIAAIAFSATTAISAPAAASPTLNFSIITNQFSKPTMEFEHVNGKYVWKQQAINTQFSASANTNDNKLHWSGPLVVKTLGVGGSASFNGNVPNDVKSWSLSGPITFPVSFLSSYQAGFASYCDENGVVGKPVVNQGLSILFSASQAYIEKLGIGEVPEEVDLDAEPGIPAPRASRTINMPMAVSCGPKPAREIAQPGGLKQETPDFKVKTIALNYGGAAPTKPNPTTECKTAKLTVTFNTTKAGVVDFRLHKKIGNGPMQAQNLQTYAKFDGNAHFVASHVEYIKVSQLTLVTAMAEEKVNPIGLSTGWKDVTLRCENANGGYAGTPGNANPDGLPSKPKQPKRTVGGPSQESAGAKPTHAPFRPVIAPATTTKTAPTGPARRFGVEREMKESGEKGGTEAPRATVRPPFFAQGTLIGIQR